MKTQKNIVRLVPLILLLAVYSQVRGMMERSPADNAYEFCDVDALMELADKGNADTMFNLGMLYGDDNDDCLPLDYDESEKWIQMAGERGDAEIYSSLGRTYEKGIPPTPESGPFFAGP